MPTAEGKKLAYHATYVALRDGLLVRPDACEGCGKPGKPQCHHVHYDLPLEVEWLCIPCHAQRHKFVDKFEAPTCPRCGELGEGLRCEDCGAYLVLR